jgi:hypothetical protein
MPKPSEKDLAGKRLHYTQPVRQKATAIPPPAEQPPYIYTAIFVPAVAADFALPTGSDLIQ